jgi:hypothetical protein
MKTLGPGIRCAAMLCVMLAVNACGLKHVADNAQFASSDVSAAPDLPAAMSLMQPPAAFADLAELRHYSAYNAFHSTTSSGGSAVNAAPAAPAACFGNQ